MPARGSDWSRTELLLVFRLYCQTPFGRLHRRNPEIVELARILGRTASAVSMKACNFASLDPELRARKIKGLGKVSRADVQLWDEFSQDSVSIAQEAEAAYAKVMQGESTDAIDDALTEAMFLPEGPTEAEMTVKARRVQSFFRAAVLLSYEYRCALTGLAIPELLIASHIIPWRLNEKRRADPRNGVCLNAFHDRAFDRGLITFDENFRLLISPQVNECPACSVQDDLLHGIAGRILQLPGRFQPDPEALAYHRERIFQK